MISTIPWRAAVGRPDRLLALVRANLALFARDPGPLAGRIIQPVLSLLILRRLYIAALGGTARGTTQVVVGYLVFFSLLGMSIVGTAVLSDRKWNTFNRLRASPAHPAELLAGKAIPVLGFILLQQSVLLGIGIAALGLRVASYGLLVLADIVWAVTVLCTGVAIAMLVRSFAQLSAVVDIGASICTALGGGLVPLPDLPGWTRAIAPLSPAYWAVLGLRAALQGQTGTTLIASAVLAATATVSVTIAWHKLARGWGRSILL
jgi:ABC-2 type transport system permease protein